MRLRYIIGMAADFEELGIDVSGCRKSLDETKTFIHQELLSDIQFNAVIEAKLGGKEFTFMSGDNADFIAMLMSEAWTDAEE